MQFKDYVNGWCLVEDKEAEFWYFRDVVGSLYYCPFCGAIVEHYKQSRHVIDPSAPLLERLKRTAKKEKPSTKELIDKLLDSDYIPWEDRVWKEK